MKRLGEAIDTAHRDQALKLLANPVAVHVNMLRGIIAKPSWQAIEHLYPEASALAAERDAATARAEGAENALFTLRNRAGCGPDQSGPDVWQQRDAAIAERDALRDEWEEIAAGITTEQPEVGALWPMVSEVSGNLAAARNLFRNEVVAHNRTKAERDRMRAAHEENARVLDLLFNDLQGRVDAGKVIAIGKCAERSRAALTSAEEAGNVD